MHQLTLRVSDDLAARLKQAAAERDRSVNSLATAVLAAAVDPDLAGEEADQIRERLARAGILAPATGGPRPRPDSAELESARRRAGRGRPLSDFVAEGRR